MKAWTTDGLAEWREGDTIYLSVVFSWRLDDAFARARWSQAMGHRVVAGGPAVALNPRALSEVAEIVADYDDAILRHNPQATITSRGCVRRCSFCAVPKLEGGLVELDEWPVRPVVCDNNLLACSRRHFDMVIDRLKGVAGVDFNQGLDARLLTHHHASRLAELKLHAVRLAWDHTRNETEFRRAFELLRGAGIALGKIRVYVLIGFNDTPEDALYRLREVQRLRIRPNPMRYQPLNAAERHSYVAPSWSEYELRRFTRYWSRLRWLEHIPFEEYHSSRHNRILVDPKQIGLELRDER